MAHTSIIIRAELEHSKISFGQVAAAKSQAGGDVTSIDVIRPGKESSFRDITVDALDAGEAAIVRSLEVLGWL